MSVETAEDPFIDGLKDFYSAEKQGVWASPRLAKVVQSEELKGALQEHLEQTKQQVERLDRVFEILEKRARGKTCEGMKELLEEPFTHSVEIEQESILDAALIGTLHRIEHYKIAAYETVATLAETMGQDEIHERLVETLQDEKDTDKKLTQAANGVKAEAINGGEEDEESFEEDEEEDDDEEEEEEEEDEEEDEEDEEDEEEPTLSKSASKSAKKSISRRAGLVVGNILTAIETMKSGVIPIM